ncbi:MAG: DUF5716 family protein [Catonella sp.]|uniref:DUF5716 family protein n=1 Tax=Catonella sp. TaxID=2382125 RepID=UPI003F9EDB7F
MKDGIGILIGMDICEDFLQLTYYDSELNSPESVSRGRNEEQYLIPARMAYRKRKDDWIIGEDLAQEGKEDINEIKNFVKTITTNEKIRVGDKIYEASRLMAYFIGAALKVLNAYCSFKEIIHIGITLKSLTKETVDLIDSAMKNLEIEDDRYSILDHDEAFLYYTINQEPELWVNDTALFELDDDGLHFRILNIDRKSEPMIAQVARREKADKLTRQMTGLSKNESGNLFYTLSLMALEGSVVSTVYAVGRGFLDSWGDDTLRKLSPGRRIFRGQNLYAKGACLAARDKTLERQSDIIMLGDDRTSVSLSIKAVKDGRSRRIEVVKPGVKWYSAKACLDIILKGEKELSIEIKDFVTGKEEQRFISFAGLGIQEESLARIRLSVRFNDKDTCIIKLADLGFGSFVPTTNRVWELIWEKQ